jgi:VCBS repeat-containing protein
MGPDVTVNEDADAQTIPAWASAIDDGDPVGSQALSFTVTNDSPALFSLQPRISQDGTLIFAAPTNAYGTATLTVTLTDDAYAGGEPITTEPRTFTITVLPVNDRPWALATSMTAPEDTPTAMTLTATDTEGDALTYAVVQAPAHGTLSGTGPTLTFTPAADYSGPDSFTYVANDGQADSNVATVTISVTPVNDPPTATDQAWTATEDTVRTATAPGILQYATDIDNFSLTAVLVQGAAHGSLTLNADGSFAYTPSADYNGADSFTYRASDSHALSNVATITITVAPVNDAPAAVDKSYATAEDTQLVVAAPGLLGGATDIDSPVTSGGPRTYPSHGILQWESDGSFRYSPAANFSGTDSFTYFVSDGWLNSADRTVTITVTPVNDTPVANGQAIASAEDTTVAVTLAATDVDGDALTYAVVSGPAHGTLSGTAPNLTYTPAADYSGPDSFTFTASDWLVTSPAAAVTINVTAVNDPPVANAGPDQTGTVGQVLSFSAAASSDPDGSIVSYSWDWGDGTPAGNGVGASHAYATAGTMTVTLTVTDSDSATATDTAVVTVNRANLALNKTASASTTYDSSTAASNAVDGTTATFWRSNKVSGTQWVRVDLGSAKSVSNVRVFWPATYYAKAFKIETSTDGSKWYQRYATTTGNGSAVDATFAAVSARYVRISCTKPNSTSYRVTELEVYQ